MKKYICILFILIGSTLIAQEEDSGSVIQTLTPSKLIDKGTYDLKWFNNMYTQTKSTFSSGKEPRQTYFTSTLEAYTGVSNNKRINIGVILRLRSNAIADRKAFDVFKFDGESGTARSGLTAIAPSVKFVPFKEIGNFSIQSSFFIPLIKNEVKNGVFLEQNSMVWQNRLFYDYTFDGDTFQFFGELNTELNLGDKNKSFANNSLNLIPGVFFSYFPSSNFTVLVSGQYFQRLDLGNNFTQTYLTLGSGIKYQLTQELNVEVLYSNFVTGTNTGLGETFNIGLRAVF